MLNALQENLLVLLAYDPERAPIVRNTVELSLFSGPYRTVAQRIYQHIDSFKKPPGDHLPDILSDKLESQSKAEGELYGDIIHSIRASNDGINSDYVISQLETFIKRQSLRTVAIDLAKTLQRDTEESLEEAEKLIASVNKANLKVFDPGVRLSDKKRALRFFDLPNNAFPTGIAELDKRGLGPTRKELWLLIGNSSAGKSWGLGHLAKMALLAHLRVCHITLEMSEDRAAQRYMQMLFAVTKRPDQFPVTKIQRDTLGRINGFDTQPGKAAFSLDDNDARRKLERRIDRGKNRFLQNIIVKEFPTGALTIHQLLAYLDNLEAAEKFTPDLLIIDYPDLMRLDRDDVRLSLDQTFKELRGIAVSRNLAVAAVSQSHRSAAKSKMVGMDNVAEAYSKIAHSDTVLTYTQTPAERKLGLARLYVAKGRNDEDKFRIVITQSYASGQFIVDSNIMRGTYWEHLPTVDDQ